MFNWKKTENNPKIFQDMNMVGMGLTFTPDVQYSCYKCIHIKKEKWKREPYCSLGGFYVYIDTVCKKIEFIPQ